MRAPLPLRGRLWTEARALEGVLAGCASTAMVMAEGQGPAAGPVPEGTGEGADETLRRWDTNGNGRITCKEAHQPVRREHPVYRFMRDGDGDGVVCE